jgi:hypothetical protein
LIDAADLLIDAADLLIDGDQMKRTLQERKNEEIAASTG